MASQSLSPSHSPQLSITASPPTSPEQSTKTLILEISKEPELSNEWFETPSWWEKLLLIKRDSDRNIREKVCEHANLHEKN